MQGWVSTEPAHGSEWDQVELGGRKRDWGTQQAVGFHCWEVVCSPAEWRNPWLAGRCWGRGVTGLALHQLHKSPVGKWGLYLWSIFRPCKSPFLAPLLKSCSFWTVLPNLISLPSQQLEHLPAMLSSYFLSSLSSVITLLTSLLETPSYVPLLIF